MPFAARRVVVEHDDHGRSVVTADETLTAVAPWPHLDITGCEMWTTSDSTVDNSPSASTGQAEGALARHRNLFVGNGHGTAFRVTHFPVDNAPVFHRTETVDYDIILTGEIDLDLDDGRSVRLAAGDCAIVRGSGHAWVNRGTRPATVAFVMIDADPVVVAGETLGTSYPEAPSPSA